MEKKKKHAEKEAGIKPWGKLKKDEKRKGQSEIRDSTRYRWEYL